MKKTLTLFMSMICMLMTVSYTAHAVAVDVSSSASWSTNMKTFTSDIAVRPLFNSNQWEADRLGTSWTGEVLTFFPNTWTYTNALGGSDSDRAFWTNS